MVNISLINDDLKCIGDSLDFSIETAAYAEIHLLVQFFELSLTA